MRLEHVPRGGAVAPVVTDTIGAAGGQASVVERLAGSDALLVMDNCEHVVDDVAGVVVEVLEAAPSTRVLATSQRPLGVDGEVVYELPPLALTDAVELFVARGRRDRLADEELVVDVCRALDGLPLAIELAAARTRSLALADIARRLDDRFAILSDPTGRRPRRQAALAAAIGWSYDLLFPDDQRCLWALACFGDGAPLDAAQAVAAVLGVPAAASLDSFDRLVDRSLARADLDTGAVRYRLLDSIRSFAAARLDEAGCGDDARRAHARWVADLAERIGEMIGGPRPAVGGRDGSRRASQHRPRPGVDGRPPAGARGRDRQRLRSGVDRPRRRRGGGSPDPRRPRRRHPTSPPARPCRRGSSPPGWRRRPVMSSWRRPTSGHADDLAASLEDPTIGADVARHHAFLAIQQGRPDEALDHALASLAIAERAGLERQIAGASNLAAFAWMARGELDLARQRRDRGAGAPHRARRHVGPDARRSDARADRRRRR